MKKEVKEEPPKPKVKVDFVPDQNFSWDFDLDTAAKLAAKKKKPGTFVPTVIKSDHQPK